MSLNIIVKGGKKRVSSGEMARDLYEKNTEAMAREKHGYMDRQLKARKQMERETGGDNIRPSAVIDAKTYFRHEQQNPGCMSDSTYRKEFFRDNPETKL